MKYAGTVLLTLMILLGTSCQGQKAKFSTEGPNTFGAEISTDGAVTLASIPESEITEEKRDVIIKGTINEVCQAKGCWMTLEDEDANRSVFIKFKDYAFFVPLDAGGKEAVIKGKLYAETTTVEELRHYAEDKGKSAEEIAAIIEPKKEIKMMADGVVIYN